MIPTEDTTRPVPEGHDPWSWLDTLATAHPESRYRVKSLLFSLVRDQCAELGCVEGKEFVCVANRRGGVTVSDDDGRTFRIEREYAWFVQVETVDRSGVLYREQSA